MFYFTVQPFLWGGYISEKTLPSVLAVRLVKILLTPKFLAVVAVVAAVVVVVGDIKEI